jgi:hypothetical protein
MKHGKQTCKILKHIRQQIAIENDLFYVTSQCKHKGDCAGTCPKCENEVRYLENQLLVRKNLGHQISIVGMAASFTAAVLLSSCEPPLEGDILPPEDWVPQDSIMAPNDSANRLPSTFVVPE